MVFIHPYIRFPQETLRLRLLTAFGRPGEHAHMQRRCCTVSGIWWSGYAAVDDKND